MKSEALEVVCRVRANGRVDVFKVWTNEREGGVSQQPITGHTHSPTHQVQTSTHQTSNYHSTPFFRFFLDIVDIFPCKNVLPPKRRTQEGDPGGHSGPIDGQEVPEGQIPRQGERNRREVLVLGSLHYFPSSYYYPIIFNYGGVPSH